MTTATSRARVEDTRFAALVAAIAGETVLAIRPTTGGANNRVFEVVTPSRRLAAKCYDAPRTRERDGLRREYGAFCFLRAAGVEAIPNPVGCDETARVALYGWIEGSPVAAHGLREIDAALTLLRQLHAARREAGAADLPAAVEAFVSFEGLCTHLWGRIERLTAVGDRELAAHLTNAVIPTLMALSRRVTTAPGGENSVRTLSPSDFSFHNALRSPRGDLVFLDFEYFGWDDPAKLCSDFLNHPGCRLSPEQSAHFRRGALELYGAGDDTFSARLAAAEPLFRLKWALIVLNEFLPDVWARRRRSGEEREWAVVKRAQLEKSESLLTAANPE